MFVNVTSCKLQDFQFGDPGLMRASLARSLRRGGVMSSFVLMSDRPEMPSGAVCIGAAVERMAVRFVKAWGFSTVETVAGRFRMTTKATASRAAIARRALAELPDLAWLDPTREWFTLLDRESAMRIAVAKIVSTVGVVDHAELELALGKRHSFGAAPPPVVRAYVSALAARVARERLFPGALLSPEEKVVLGAFEHAGGAATLEDLRERTRHRLASAALTRVLQASPLFVRSARAAYRVVGSPLLPVPALVPWRQWQAAL